LTDSRDARAESTAPALIARWCAWADRTSLGIDASEAIVATPSIVRSPLIYEREKVP